MNKILVLYLLTRLLYLSSSPLMVLNSDPKFSVMGIQTNIPVIAKQERYGISNYYLTDNRPDLSCKIPALTTVSPLSNVDVTEGVYMIVHQPTGKLLDAGQASATINGIQPVIHEGKVMQDNKVEFYQRWKVNRVGGISGGYTIGNLLSGKVLDSDYLCMNENGCKVTVRDRLALFVPDRRNQEWYIERIGNGQEFRIRNVLKAEQVLDPGATSANGTKVGTNKKRAVASQQWRFVKVN